MIYIFLFYICIISITLFCVLSVFYLFGLTRKNKNRPDYYPSISILVSARNEENCISSCIHSLSKLDYPIENLEVILIDDNSEDRTVQIIEQFISDNKQFRLIKMADMKKIDLPGKTGALATAIPLAKGDIIVQTDADCMVSPTWAKELVKYFTEETAALGGFTIFHHPERPLTLFEQIANLDLIYLLGIGSGSATLGIPLSCIGNNLAFRKSVYESVGGYENIEFSVTEDFALMRTIHKKRGGDVLLPIDEKTVVYTHPVDSFSKFIKQRRRWAKGGLRIDFFGFWMSVIALAGHLGIIYLLIFPELNALIFSAITVFFATDILLLGTALKKLKMLKYIKLYPLYKFFAVIYGVIVTVSLIIKPEIDWKGRKF